MPEASLAPAAAAGGFTWIDWAVVALVLGLATWIGERMSGRPATIRDFFLGGRRLPWYAIAGSFISTEISAVTLISLSSVVWKEGGNLTYLQIGLIGSLVARLLVAWILVPAYYEREIYSPYDYVGRRLGEGARRATTVLFVAGQLLAQSARVYLTAVVLEVILHGEFAWLEARTGLSSTLISVSVLAAVSLAWTLIGGITTVIWTDVMMFAIFLAAIAIALVHAVSSVDGGVAEVVRAGAAADKFRFFDFSADPSAHYTFWAALLAQSWAGVGAYGVDQLMAQRIFCCRSVRDARLAVVASYGALSVTVLVGLVGIALYAFYRQHPLEGEALRMVTEKPDRIFPVFIVAAVPTGLKGLMVAGILAAAVSSSTYAALGQTVLSAFYLPWRERARRALPSAAAEQRHVVRVSRALVVVFAVLLSALAVLAEAAARHYNSILDLALAMATYAQGALLAGFLLAFLRLGVDGSGFLFSAPLSVLGVFALAWRPSGELGDWPRWVLQGGCAALLVAWLAARLAPSWKRRADLAREGARTLVLAGGIVLVLALQDPELLAGWVLRSPADRLSYMWYVPAGCALAFVFGYMLARPKPAGSDR